ncbi:MAG: FtsX-like permease family protein [Sedimentisphaerales bacterium]|nr:FtsX-like permease family protein [Sedimentisphaerales bacterium]
MYRWVLALRYLVSRRVTLIAVLVVALCVFVVFVVMTVMNGLVGQFKERTHSFVGDCVVATESMVGFPYYDRFMDVLRSEPMVDSVSPVIRTYGLVALAGRQDAVGIEIMGIEPNSHFTVTGLGQGLHLHRDDPQTAFCSQADPNIPGCILGIDLVLNRDSSGEYDYRWLPLKATYDISCFPLTARGALERIGTGYVNTKRFGFSDVSHTGLAREDGGLIYVHFDQLQGLCGMSRPPARATAIHIRFKPKVSLQHGTRQVEGLWDRFAKDCQGMPQADLLGLVRVQDWKTYRKSTIAPMEKEQIAMIVMFILVATTAVSIVLVVFYMIVSSKTRDIGILKAVGESFWGVIGLVVNFALLIGLVSAFLGVLAGWLFLRYINQIEGWLFARFGFQLWDRTIFSIGQIPNQIQMGVVAVIVMCALLVCLTGCLLPAIRAARTQPVDTLRASPI